MRKLLILLLLFSTSVFADETTYTGEAVSDITVAAIATALSRPSTDVYIDTTPSDERILVIIATMTGQEIIDLDTLMVTTNGLTKQ